MELKHIKNDLTSPKPRVVFEALQAIGRISKDEKPEAIAILEKWLVHGEHMYRYTALLSLIELGAVDHHLEQVKLMLDDADPKIREAAVIALGKTSKRGITNLLIELLSSPKPEIRYQAPISLAERGDQAAAKPLLALLERESDVEIRVNVLAALGDLKVTRALDKIMEIAKDDTYEIVRFEAACSAGRMGERRAAQLLAAWADHFEYGLTACTILGDLEEQEVLGTLTKKYGKLFMSADRRLPLAATLARLGDDRGKEYLVAKSRAFSLETRILALDRLGRTRKEWAIAPLMEALGKKDAHTRDAALQALEELGLSEAATPLKRAIEGGTLGASLETDARKVLSGLTGEQQ